MTSDLSEYFAFKNLNISQNKQISILICKQVKSYFKEEEGKSHTFGLIVSNKKKNLSFQYFKPRSLRTLWKLDFCLLSFYFIFLLKLFVPISFLLLSHMTSRNDHSDALNREKILKMSEEKNQVICFTQICKLGSFLRLPVELQCLHFFIGGVPTIQSVFEENMRTNVHLPKAHSAVIKCVTYFIQWDD